MGTRLIIKGADFSANGIQVPVDITSRFTFSTGAYNEDGSNAASTAFIRSDTIDISSYAGRTMNISWCAYRKSSDGGRVSYHGLFFYDSENNKISSERIPQGNSEIAPNGKGYCVDRNIVIPSDAKYFKTTYLASSSMETQVSFYCIIL